ncbi:MAG: hypothetical protein NTX79_03605 [Candidatus Micrarchaeota archaeon]|nr:hypothetical protein [Candidatus Micrarchaeota archaeon]
MRKLGILVVMAALMASAFAATTILGGVQTAMSSLCAGLTSMLPVVAMLMIIAGQMMGAETRARANVWATAALTGALIAILITVVAPPVLTMMNNGTAVECGTVTS